MDVTFTPIVAIPLPALVKPSPADAVPTPAPAPAPQNAPAAPQATLASSTPSDVQVTLTQAAEQHTQDIRQALSFKNVYAISDRAFAIYKDATGQYITRYISLRDGSVTYVPKPNYTRPIPGLSIVA